MNATNFTDYEMLDIIDADLVKENIVEYRVVEDVMVFLSGVVSVACVCATCTAWALMPSWRSLQAYITINETVFGTLSNILFTEYFYSLQNLFGCECSKLGSDRIAELFLFLSVCWSLCASVVAYVKLVRVKMVQTSHEKKIVTGAAYGIFLASAIADWYDILDGVMVLLALLFLILGIFVVICVSVLCCRCGAGAASDRSWTHVLALAGVGFVCQSMTLVYVFVLAGIAFVDSDVPFYFAYGLYLYRFVPSSFVLLFNQNTRQLWKRYAQQKRNRDACREFYL